MKISIWLLASFVVTQVICSCATVRINENSNYLDSQFTFGPNKTALLVSGDNVMINEFRKTFDKKFKNKENFVNQYDSLCSIKLKEENIFGDIKFDKSFNFVSADLITFDKDQQKKVDSLFTNTTADYLIKINNYEIANSIQGNGGMMMPMGNGSGMGMTMGTQSESCIVKSHFQVYDIKTRKKVLDFVSLGKAGVLLFGFEKALMEAINSSIKNSGVYLKTGKLKF